MSVHNFKELLEHEGHQIECVTYATKLPMYKVNVALECVTCGVVLLDFNAEDDLDSNYAPCDICGQETSFERALPAEPHEGEKCSICGKWVCVTCVDWGYMASERTEDIICVNCGDNPYKKRS